MLSRIRVNVELLAEGTSLNNSIHDEQGRELLTGKVPISAAFLQQLSTNNIEWVLLHTLDAAEVMGVADEVPEPESDDVATGTEQWRPRIPSRAIPTLSSVKSKVDSLVRTASFTVENVGSAFKDSMSAKGCVPFDTERKEVLGKQLAEAVDRLDGLINEVLADKTGDSQSLDTVAGMHIRELTQDADLALSASTKITSVKSDNVDWFAIGVNAFFLKDFRTRVSRLPIKTPRLFVPTRCIRRNY